MFKNFTPKQKERNANAEERSGFGEYYTKCWNYWAENQIRIFNEPTKFIFPVKDVGKQVK